MKDLTCLEERLVSARIPFMQIRTLGYDKQCGIKGQIVNVPLDVNSTAKILPRNVQDTQTIQLKLKRRVCYERAYLCETIRPKKVMDALKYLIGQPLYQSEGITLSKDWEKTIQNNRRDQDSVVSEQHETSTANDDVTEISTMLSGISVTEVATEESGTQTEPCHSIGLSSSPTLDLKVDSFAGAHFFVLCRRVWLTSVVLGKRCSARVTMQFYLVYIQKN